MKHGIHIPAIAVRVLVGAFVATTVTALAFSAPDLVRYLKIRQM